jgi:hypothetical protein
LRAEEKRDKGTAPWRTYNRKRYGLDLNGGSRECPLLEHLRIETSHRHFADDIIRLCLIAPVNNVPFLFVSKYGIGCRGAISSPLHFIRRNVRSMYNDQRRLNLVDVWSRTAKRDVCRIRYGSGFKIGVPVEEF